MSLALRCLFFSASNETGATVRWRVLLALGGLGLAFYWLGLIRPYGLHALMVKPLLDIAQLTRDQPFAQAGFVATFAALSGLYYLGWRVCRGQQSRRMWIALLVAALAFNVSLMGLYPIDAADVFDNIMRGRITAQYGGNPFYETPNDYKRDPFRAYAAWRDATSAYGPVWEDLAAGASRVAGDDKLANVLVFKALGLVFYFGCIALIAAILRRQAPERAVQGVCLFAWNPLVIYETAGNGHNDIVMVFFVVLAMFAMSRRRFTSAALALTAGALVKFIPILLWPVVFAAGLRAVSGWKARARFVIGTLLACAALIVVAYAPFWRGGDPLSVERRSTLFTTSLPAMAQVRLEASLETEASQRVVSGVALSLIGGVVAVQTWRVWRKLGHSSDAAQAWLIPVRAATSILLFYLLVVCLWFQPWYALWPLALAALLPEGAMARTVVLLSYAAVWKTIVFDFFLVPGRSLPPRLVRETLIGPATLGIVWLYAGYVLIARRLSRGVRYFRVQMTRP